MSDYVANLELINRKLRTEVKREVADNYDKLIGMIDKLKKENKKLRDRLEKCNKELQSGIARESVFQYNLELLKELGEL